jgi:hypothetical protein
MDLFELQRNLDAFLATVRIETDGEPQPYAEVCDPWQLDDLYAIAPAIERLVNPRAPEPKIRRAWWVRPRGHSKTSDVAMLIARVLAFSRRRRRCVWVAADKDQGCEGLDTIATLCRHNPWLDELLTITQDRVTNKRTGSVCYFTTSDVSSAFGWKDCDLFVMDEITHWPDKGEDLWTAMYSAAGKRKNAIVFALMNAGFQPSWQRDLRDKAEADPAWAFSELPDAVATWIDEAALADQAKFIPEAAFNRLWRNWWASGLGDAISQAEIDAAFVDALRPLTKREPGWLYVCGVDLSKTRHFSACCVLGVKAGGQSGMIRLAHHKVWRPARGQKINYLAIERHILELDEKFGLEFVGSEGYEMEHLSQTLEADTDHKRRNARRRFRMQPWVRDIFPAAKNLQQQASLVIEGFADGRFEFYRCPELKADLQKVRVIERPNRSFRLESPRDTGQGHGDLFSAFAVGLVLAHEVAGDAPVVIGAGDGVGGSPASAQLAMLAAEAEMIQREESGPVKREWELVGVGDPRGVM